MIRPRQLLFGLLLLGATPAAAQEAIRSDGPYVHAFARAVFPPRVGDFVRSDMYRYDR